jgi:hypothetical protein
MTAAFHRLTVPTYFGGLPSGYDYINNATSGTPAYADGVLSGGTNAGSYFVGFDDDATSANANRPALALATNTDYLDNLLHRDIAIPVRSGSGSISDTGLTLVGPGVFMGLVGDDAFEDLFHITDLNDEDILNASGTKMVVTAAVDGGGTPVSIGGGFSSGNVALTFNFPAPVAYQVYYAERGNFATFPADGLTSVHIRDLTEVDSKVEELFRLLHGNNEAWNAAWDSTVWDLTARGLDGAYRRSTTGVSGAFNTPGSGGVITRDGQSLTVQGTQTARAYVDPYQALYTAQGLELGADQTTYPLGSGGFLFLGREWTIAGSSTSTEPTPSLYGFQSFSRHLEPILTGSPTTGHGYATKIAPNTSATIATTATPGLYEVVLGSGYFWNNVSNDTMVALGIDVLEVTIAGVTVALTMVEFLSSPVSVYCTTLDSGSIAAITAGPTACTVTWVAGRMGYRYGASNAKQLFGTTNLGTVDGGFYCLPPAAPLTRDTLDNSGAWKQLFGVVTAYFGAHYNYINGSLGIALAWGSLERDMTGSSPGVWQQLGTLLSDGSINASAISTLSAGANTVGFADLSVTGAMVTNLGQFTSLQFSVENTGGPYAPVISSEPHIGSISGQGPIKGTVHDQFTNIGNVTTTGGTSYCDFSNEADAGVTLATSVPRWGTAGFVVASGVTSFTVGQIRLPFNVAVGMKFVLIGSEPFGTGGILSFTGGIPNCATRSGGGKTITVYNADSFGSVTGANLLPVNPSVTDGTFTSGGHHVWELTCVHSDGTSTVYVMTSYAAFHP